MEIRIRITNQSVTRKKIWVVNPFVQNKKHIDIDKLCSVVKHICHKLVQLNQGKALLNVFDCSYQSHANFRPKVGFWWTSQFWKPSGKRAEIFKYLPFRKNAVTNRIEQDF